MPHSSGGGSSGGGSHGGSGGSSHGPSYRTSTRPFPGAVCYIYYDSRSRPRMLYTNEDPTKPKKVNVATYILMGVFLLVPAAIIAFAGIHNPQKLTTNYNTTLIIQDDLHTLSDEEKSTLSETFQEFFALSGVCPSLLTVDNLTWMSQKPSLEDYAYQTYVNRFSDEKHWLIVYAANNADKNDWHFEGMQGNDTDSIITTKVANTFNDALVAGLQNPNTTAGQAINDSFQAIMPGLMDFSFYVEPGLWIFAGVWTVTMGFIITTQIVSDVRGKALRNAVKAPSELKLERCEYCGAEYYVDTTSRCPNCGASLGPMHYASVPEDFSEK